MSDTFLNSVETENGEYTNMVTAEDLNNIARDLGIPDYSYFPEEPPESAVSALNQITKDLTSKGVLHIGNECKVSTSGDTINVADGVCVFDTGAKKRIGENDVVTVGFLSGATNYVYLLHNEADNKIQLISSHDEPTDGNFVMLAEIDEKHNITDRRYWSVSKTANGVNKYLEVSENFKFMPTLFHADNNGGGIYTEQVTEYVYDVRQIGPQYCIFESKYYTNSLPVVAELEEGVEVSLRIRDDFSYRMTVEKKGSKVIVRTNYSASNRANSISTKWYQQTLKVV